LGEATNAAEMKAASSGNPLILEEIKLRQEIKKVEALQSGSRSQRYKKDERGGGFRKHLWTNLTRLLG